MAKVARQENFVYEMHSESMSYEDNYKEQFIMMNEYYDMKSLRKGLRDAFH